MDALSPDDSPEDGVVVRYGVRKEITARLQDQRRVIPIAQFWGLVEPGLIIAKHLFQGLERGLYFEGDMNADQRFLIYTWRSSRDYRWQGDPHYGGLLDTRQKVGCFAFWFISMNKWMTKGSLAQL